MARLPILDPIAQPRKRDLPPGRRDDFEGTITDPWVKYFEDLNTTVQSNPSRLTRVSLSAQGAAIGATSLPVSSLNAGLYRIAYFARITTAAVTSSSLTVTFAFTSGGVACCYSGAAITGNTTATFQSGTQTFLVDAATPITYSTAYASNGAGEMKYALEITVEKLAA